MPRLLSVAIPIPFVECLTYRVPETFSMPVIGARVLVPLGSRIVTGCVVNTEVENSHELKDLLEILDIEPFLPREVVELALWVADYYACSPGDAISLAMPPNAWIESQLEIQISDFGRIKLKTKEKDGKRDSILRALASGKAISIKTLLKTRIHGTVSRNGIATKKNRVVKEKLYRDLYALVMSLAKEGLVVITQPLRGKVSSFKIMRVAGLTKEGIEVLNQSSKLSCLGRRQRETMEVLCNHPDGLGVNELKSRNLTTETIKRLTARGLLTVWSKQVERDPFLNMERSNRNKWQHSANDPDEEVRDLRLTYEQNCVLEKLNEYATRLAFRVILLHGVTGSGKTEIYLRLSRVVQQSGRRVLILVPEIVLTPVMARAFKKAFDGYVAIQHSGLSEGERHDQWHRIRRGEVSVVVGTRSAVFAPLDSIGLIIVDEEQDSSYKQEEGVRYNARDVAVMRGKRNEALVVLGSATPSMESYHNSVIGRYERLSLSRRVFNRPLPSVKIVNMREEFATHGPTVILSEQLRAGLGSRIERREQSLVLLNRRGFASVLLCRQCDLPLECPNCSVSLTLHRARRQARCHYCNYSLTKPKTCPQCAGPYLEQLGFGTQRVEDEVRRYFCNARVERLDRDTARRRGAASDLLNRFAGGDIDILVGTQMIAKGHDFPRVTLVGVVSADVGLGLADFRAAERTFQLLTQVAGRAGRGDSSGEAIIQTLYPHHYSIRYACDQVYGPFFEEESRFRRGMRYPPLVCLINAVVRGRSLEAAMRDAGTLADGLRFFSDMFTVLGPAPAPIEKIRGEYRAQLFLKGTNRRSMRESLRDVITSKPELRRRVTVDVDPLSML